MLQGSLKWVLRAMAFAVFMALVGFFSVSPTYTHMNPENSLIKLAFSHAAQPIEECRQLTQEELNQMAPNMRRPTQCPRERVPMMVEVYLDDELLYRGEHQPTGLWKDGPATVYQRFVVPPGRYRLHARLRDSRRAQGFDYEHSEEIELAPQQNFVIGFRPAIDGFTFN